jgi:putative redox protein
MTHVEVRRVSGDFGFEAKDSLGHTVAIDTSPETGGRNYGARPMQMLLMALGGCSGIDVVSILKKQRQQIESFRMLIQGEREKGKEPSLWQHVKIVFELAGEIDYEKARRACELSIDKYCSVAATLRGAGCNIQWEVKVTKMA